MMSHLSFKYTFSHVLLAIAQAESKAGPQGGQLAGIKQQVEDALKAPQSEVRPGTSLISSGMPG